MTLGRLDVKGFFFIVILLLLIGLALQLVLPFLNILIIAILLVEFFHPLYNRIHKVIKNSGLASIITTFLTLFLVIMPITLVFLLVVAEIGNVTSNTDTAQWVATLETGIHDLAASINSFLTSIGVPAENHFSTPDIQELANSALLSVRDSLLPLTTSIISFSVNSLFTLFLLIVTLFYTFMEYENISHVMSKVSPLDNHLDEMLFEKFTTTTRAVIKGTFLVALAQATAVSIMMIMLGVGAPILLWVVMLLLSIIPVGSGLVWFPVGVILIGSGQPVEGILLIVYSAVIINVIDTLLRPYVIKDAINLHPFAILLSVISGIMVFNSPLGIFYGPLVLVFFTSLMHIYDLHFAGTSSYGGEPKPVRTRQVQRPRNK